VWITALNGEMGTESVETCGGWSAAAMSGKDLFSVTGFDFRQCSVCDCTHVCFTLTRGKVQESQKSSASFQPGVSLTVTPSYLLKHNVALPSCAPTISNVIWNIFFLSLASFARHTHEIHPCPV